MAANQITISVGGSIAPSLAQSATQASGALNGIGSAAAAASSSLQRMPPAAAPAARGFGTVGREANSAASSMQRIPPAAGPAGAALGSVGAQATSTSAALSRLRASSNTAGFALTNVGRVAQDLPFGFIGIQNNLNPLLESFQRLRQETGSNRAAFAALRSSLVGPAGIGLALSIVSSFFVIYQNGIAGFNKKSKEAKEAADELRKSIRSIASVEGEGAASVQGQVAQVNALARVIGDTNKSYEGRKRALSELREINKQYFGDLQVEDAATGKLTSTVQEYTKALINNAIQKQFIDEIAKVAKSIADAEDNTAKARLTAGKAARGLQTAEENVNKARAKGTTNAQGTNSLVLDAITAQGKATNGVNDAQKALNIARDTELRLNEQKLLLENRLNKAVQEGLKFKDLSASKDAKGTDLLKQRIDALKELQSTSGLDSAQRNELIQLQVRLLLRDGKGQGFTPSEIQDQIDALIRDTFDKLPAPKAVEVQVPIKLARPTIDVGGAILGGIGIQDNAFDGVVKAISNAAKTAQDKIRATTQEGFLSAIAESATQGVFEAADILGSSLGEIFSGGNVFQSLATAAQGFLGIIGGILQDVGKQIAVISGLVVKLKEAIASIFTNPYAGIGVGLALVAVGALLKNIKFNVPKFAEGGIATGATLGIFGEAGTEAIIPLNKLPDLVGQIAGGNMSVTLQPSIRFRGADFQIMLNEVDRRRGQLG